MTISRFFATVTVTALFASVASATILTFDQKVPVSNSELVEQAYGDNVTALTDGNDNSYGVGAEGFTPDVTVTYQGFNGSSPSIELWNTGYGDLTNVLYDEFDFVGRLEIRFEASPGFFVQLYDWDMATYSGSDDTIDFVRVLDGNDNVLANFPDQVISSSTRTSFDFASDPLTAPVIRLQFDAGNLGGSSDNIGVDNIRFGQVVPEPASLVLLSVAGLLVARRRG